MSCGRLAARLGPRNRGSSSTATRAPYLGVHQRLDVDTSGVVLFAIDRAANDSLADQFARHTVEKRYIALVDAFRRPDLQPGDSWVSRGALAPTGGSRNARMAVVATGGQPAETAFSVLARGGDRALIEAHPRTGRKHQIRAHLHAARLVIVGDGRYGWRGSASHRVLLHAVRLALRHPVSGAPMVLASPLPKGFTVAPLVPPLRRPKPGAAGKP